MRSAIDQYIIDQVYFKRKALKISQLKLAYAIGHKSVAYIAAIESMNLKRTEFYNNKQLNLIARAFNCSPKEFQPESYINDYVSPRKLL